MWRSTSTRLRFQPKIGDVVICKGTPNVYNKTGRMQFVLQQMVPAGEGELKRKFEELKAKLEREGLFDEDRKRQIPLFPKAVGVVTSKTGAVIHDIMVKVKERMPSMPVYLVDARVQGEGAAQEIAEGIELLNRFGKVDVIIVARGGGSLEDLWAFNEEPVVRAVFASKIPIVSGVGHEVDISLCDLAADLRAPTPTAAAEFVVPKKSDLEKDLLNLFARLSNYESWLQPLWQQVDDLYGQFNQNIKNIVQTVKLKLDLLSSRIKLIHPRKIIENNYAKIDVLRDKLLFQTNKQISVNERGLNSLRIRLNNISPLHQIKIERTKLAGMAERFKSLAPQNVLQRGYAMVESTKGIIRDPKEVSKGEKLKISVQYGAIEAKVL